MKVLSFPEKEVVSEVNEELVRMLSQLLDWAKEGHIDSAAVVIRYPDGSTGNCFNTNYPTLMIGELRALERDILDIMISGRCHEAGTDY